MNIATAHDSRSNFAALDDSLSFRQTEDLDEISALARRFRQAHARLNDVELQLHDSFTAASRHTLLSTLEEARMEYSDARFALSTRDAISSRR